MANELQTRAAGLESPAQNAAAITPNDSTDLTNYARALYVGVTGDIVVDLVQSGSSITIKAAPVGILPISVKRVRSTGTTATNLLALW